MKCAGCDIEELPGEVFERREFSTSSTQRYCPNCRKRHVRQFLLIPYLLNVVIFLFGISLLIGDRYSKPGWMFTNLPLVPVFMLASTILHELGHLVGALSVGFTVSRITIGTGRPLARCQLFGIPIVVFQLPMGGLCYMKQAGEAGQKWRWILAIAMGPLINLVLAGAVWLGFGSSVLVPQFEESAGLASTAFWINIYMFIANMRPRNVSIEGRKQPSDGMTLLKLCFPGWRIKGGKSDEKPSVSLGKCMHWILVFVMICTTSILLIIAIGFGIHLKNEALLLNYSWLVAFLLFLAGTMAYLVFGAIKGGSASPPKKSSRVLSFESARLSEMKERWSIAEPLGFQRAAVKLDRLTKQGDFIGAEAALAELSACGGDIPLVWFCSIELAMNQGRRAEAAAMAEGHIPKAATAPITRVTLKRYRWLCLAHLGQYEEIRSEVDQCLEVESDVPFKIWILDELACWPFTHCLTGYLEEARHWVELALSLQPGSLTLLGTKGSLLAEAGNWEESVKLLTHVEAKSEASHDQGIASLYLALDAKRRGDMKGAARWAKRSRDLCVQPWLVKRLKLEFPEIG